MYRRYFGRGDDDEKTNQQQARRACCAGIKTSFSNTYNWIADAPSNILLLLVAVFMTACICGTLFYKDSLTQATASNQSHDTDPAFIQALQKIELSQTLIYNQVVMLNASQKHTAALVQDTRKQLEDVKNNPQVLIFNGNISITNLENSVSDRVIGCMDKCATHCVKEVKEEITNWHQTEQARLADSEAAKNAGYTAN